MNCYLRHRLLLIITGPGGPGRQVGEFQQWREHPVRGRRPSLGCERVRRGGGYPSRLGALEINPPEMLFSYKNIENICSMVHLGMINIHLIIATATG